MQGVLLGMAGVAYATPAGEPEAAVPYVDRLIGDREAGDTEPPSADELEDTTPGLTSLVVEGRWHARRSNQIGNLDEYGLYVLSRRETLNYGDIFVEAAGRSTHGEAGAFLYDRSRSNRVLLQQVNMPLAGGWSLSNALGVTRTINAEPFVSGYRFSLPTALLTGAQSLLASPRSTLSLETGEVTQLEGFQALGARRLDGRASGATWTQRLDERWQFGLKGLRFDSDLEAGNYSAWTAALAHASSDGSLRWNVQTLADDRQRGGQWFEGDWRSGLRHSRWSLWHFDPWLYWYSTLLSTGQRGLALQHDFSDLRRYWGVGVEAARNDPLQAGRAPSDQTRLSLNGGLRIDRATSIGMVGQWRRLVPDFDDGWSLEQRYSSLGLILSRARGVLSDRVEYNWVRHVADQRSTLHELLWTRDIAFSDDRSVGFTLGYGHERTPDGSHRRPSVGLAYNGPLGEGGTLSGYLRHSRESDLFTTAYGWSGTVQATWPLTSRWSVVVNASLNRLAFDVDTPIFTAPPVRLRERSMTVTLRYAQAGGTPFLADQPGSARGAGTVEGVVFIDANRDGVRQPGERVVPGVVVVLDGVMTATSGPNGRFEFPIVRQGPHVLRVDSSTVRLPYGLADEAPRRFEVPVRAIHRLEVPLVRTDE